MEKKNTVLLIVIAIATLLVAVVGATFAYFATTINTNEGFVNVVARADTASSVFLATGEDLTLNITADAMKNAEVGNNVTATKNLVISYGSSKDDYETSCTYDIVFYWTDDSEAKYLPGTATPPTLNEEPLNEGKEFTVAVGTATKETADEGVSADNNTLTGMAEANISYNVGTCTTRDGIMNNLTCDTAGGQYTATQMMLVQGAKISSNTVFSATDHCSDSAYSEQQACTDAGKQWITAGGGVTVTWPITMTFYNLDLNQNALAGHTYNGHVQVTNVVCE